MGSWPTRASSAPGTWSPTGGPRGFVRDTENFIAHSQTDLSFGFDTGAVRHDVVAGVSFSKEDFELDSGSGFRNADGSELANDNSNYPLQDLDNPYNVWTGPRNFVRTGHTEGCLDNQAVYVFDTLKFNDRWLLNLGARYEHNEGDTVTYGVTEGRITGVTNRFENEEDLFSYRAGVVYKPADNASVYLSYANSKTPSKTSVNGACNANTCNVDPETAVNVELGTKWDVLENRLALTAALFRNERRNYKVASADPLQPEQVLDGKARVDGLALGMAGNITREWAVFANYTFLDSEVLQNAADEAASDPVKGRELTQTPRHAASLWTTYALGDWTFGYGTTYQGSFYPNNANEAVYRKTDAYWVHRAMIGYQINERIGLQLNVSNLFDEEYYTGIRNNLTVDAAGVVTAGNGWANPGEGRSAVLTATLRF